MKSSLAASPGAERSARFLLAERLPLATGLVAAALVIRSQLTAVGPLLPRIEADFGVGQIWVGLISVSLGALFTLSLTLSALVAADAQEAAAITGLQFGVGYTAAALAPLALGILRDATGGFGAALWVVAAFALLVEAAVFAAARLLRHRR